MTLGVPRARLLLRDARRRRRATMNLSEADRAFYYGGRRRDEPRALRETRSSGRRNPNGALTVNAKRGNANADPSQDEQDFGRRRQARHDRLQAGRQVAPRRRRSQGMVRGHALLRPHDRRGRPGFRSTSISRRTRRCSRRSCATWVTNPRARRQPDDPGSTRTPESDIETIVDSILDLARLATTRSV